MLFLHQKVCNVFFVNKQKNPLNRVRITNGDSYGIRTRECLRERQVS